VALVFQQHAVLECNLDLPIGKFCGEMVDGQWNKEYWTREVDKCMVIVCTAAILQKLLTHSFLRINQINLLVFDECHHAKKNHPYARIIKDFYIKERNVASRPRILGMTASPVDAQTDVSYAAQELETVLHSVIATVPESMLANSDGVHTDRHTEYQEIYPSLPNPFETTLCAMIKAEMPHNKLFKKFLSAARNAASELGPWCADRYWQLCLTEEEVAKLKARSERDQKELNYAFASVQDAAGGIERVLQIVRQHEFPTPIPTEEYLSAKVLHLRTILQESFSLDSDNRCIVFVEQRATAIVLRDLFEQPSIKPPFLKVAPLVSIACLRQRLSLTTLGWKQRVRTYRHDLSRPDADTHQVQTRRLQLSHIYLRGRGRVGYS
jgi:endoribonuclease Dicer